MKCLLIYGGLVVASLALVVGGLYWICVEDIGNRPQVSGNPHKLVGHQYICYSSDAMELSDTMTCETTPP